MTNVIYSLHTWTMVAEFAIILFLVWLFYTRFIKNTNADKLVRGLFGLGAIWMASIILSWLHLDILGALARWIALFLSVGLVVIFQPELRKFLGMLGKLNFFTVLFMPKKLRDEAAHKSMEHSIWKSLR